MNDIRKYMTMLAAAGFVMALTRPGYAAFSTKGAQTLPAGATTGGTPTIAISSVAIFNRSNNSPAGGLIWSGATPGAGWLVADQYIQLATNINVVDGAVQIYTDNTHATGASKYTGLISSTTATPAGLVNNSDGTQKLPTAWRASTFTLTGVNPIDPNAGSGESFLWFFHEDLAQVAVPSQNAAVFGNGDPYITVYASPATPLVSQADGKTYTTNSINSGIHFAQGPTQFGGFNTMATTFIYTEANFASAFAQATYSTTKLILEAFSL